MKFGDVVKFEGVDYVFWKESGETHFFAQECGNPNMKIRRIAYADLIAEMAKTEKTNPRFVAFTVFIECVKKGASRNVRFMSFISDVVKCFAKFKGCEHTAYDPFHIHDQDEFTQFILDGSWRSKLRLTDYE